MARLEELPLKLRLFLRGYRWRRIEPVPESPLSKPLSECRVALVSSAGLVEPDQEPFDDNIRGGDYGFRVLRSTTDPRSLIESHRSESFDRAGLEEDPSLVFPLPRLREMEDEGRIAEVAPRHLSFMGSITAPGRLLRDSLPEAAEVFVEDRVDVALLVPV